MAACEVEGTLERLVCNATLHDVEGRDILGEGEAVDAPADANPVMQEALAPAQQRRWGRFDAAAFKAQQDAKATAKQEARRAQWAEEYKGRELTPVNVENVRWALITLLHRVDAELARGADGCNETGAQELLCLASEAASLYANLAVAFRGLEMLESVSDSLMRRIGAVAEVLQKAGLAQLGGVTFDVPGRILQTEDIPQRWRPSELHDEDIPF